MSFVRGPVVHVIAYRRLKCGYVFRYPLRIRSVRFFMHSFIFHAYIHGD